MGLGSRPSSSIVVLPGAQRGEHARVPCRRAPGPRRGRRRARRPGRRSRRRVADDPVARVARRPRRRSRGRRPCPATSLVAPRKAIIALNTGKPSRSSASTSRTPPSMTSRDATRLCRGREHLAPVAELGLDPDVDDERAARPVPRRPRRGSRGCRRACTRTGNAGAAMRAPGHVAVMRARIGRPPLSPSVAAPSARERGGEIGVVMRSCRSSARVLAEGEGFEPSRRLNAPYSLSRRAPSATRSALRSGEYTGGHPGFSASGRPTGPPDVHVAPRLGGTLQIEVLELVDAEAARLDQRGDVAIEVAAAGESLLETVEPLLRARDLGVGRVSVFGEAELGVAVSARGAARRARRRRRGSCRASSSRARCRSGRRGDRAEHRRDPRTCTGTGLDAIRFAAIVIATPDGSTAHTPVTAPGRCGRFSPEPKPSSITSPCSRAQTRSRTLPNVVFPSMTLVMRGHDLLGVEAPSGYVGEKGTVEVVEPVEALERIAELLVRGGEPRYKAQAFRRAAREIKHVPRRRAASGSTRSAGCRTSPASATRPRRSSPKRSPARRRSTCRSCSRTRPNPGADAGEALRVQLKGDLHDHSDWSDGGHTIRAMAEKARDLGHEYFALTDHSPRLTIANGLSRERLLEQLDVVAELNEELAPFRILTGVEVDILDDGALDHADDMLERLDWVVASVHSKLRMDGEAMTRRMVNAISHPQVDVLGHCTGRLLTGRGRPKSEFDHDAVLDGAGRARHRARDQLAARTPRPAEGDAPRRGGRGPALHDQHRRARDRPARLAGLRHRPRRRVRRDRSSRS